MKKMKFALFSLFLTSIVTSNVASAQVLGGILCGIGAYCPPQVPSNPAAPEKFILIEGASIGKSLPDFYNFNDYSYLSEVLKIRIKDIGPFYSFTWEKKINYSFIVQSTFEVLKVGKRFDGHVPCFQYRHIIKVKETSDQNRKGNIIATEDIIANACSVTPDYTIIKPNSIYNYMFYDTSAANIIFKK